MRLSCSAHASSSSEIRELISESDVCICDRVLSTEVNLSFIDLLKACIAVRIEDKAVVSSLAAALDACSVRACFFPDCSFALVG